MWTLTGFADEISPDLDEQIALLSTLGVRHLELRSVEMTKVLDLSQDQLEQVKARLDAAGIALSSIGSDLGKILVTDPFEEHLERTRHAVEVARLLGAPYIRVFSFFIPEGEDPAQYRDEVLRRTRAMVEVAEGSGVVLLHENEKDIYGDVPSRVADLLSTIDSPSYRAAFDPANYVQCGVRPVDEAWPLVKDRTVYIHCKDAKFPTGADDLGEVTPCGEGDGQWPELVRVLKDSGYRGFFSLEPHLGDFDAYGALSGPEGWTRAHTALLSLFTAVGVEAV
ncbi:MULTISPECIES: sugar phosphate isomerase/epimerase family protein [unclassified Actinomyces]|uniref:sugar phosphate isomerase/epimerase family protein n=1 Tax=unclassified Actinomyces TaxID=2609248 RepID=UPI002016F38F|nr:MULTISPECIES: sugar phosphate isomerase/epimerase family protein [unclassified Actinomyces]MCL3778281.1 sugar phosphate isomerase/epimerase [Actinomyces sp. AC-20-1]MCL3788743.1 sugar phosphate isomerase/epimerase [Actinomyces sp. 187325]MCL3792858.1 sugar phosphate isomerase/epimerase [Actinomyces sp. 186855]MCL3794373.1 sugar phosphate isomerase/epimerase [Actinomyces sp. 217892]